MQPRINLVTFTEEIRNEKLFLCSDPPWDIKKGLSFLKQQSIYLRYHPNVQNVYAVP